MYVQWLVQCETWLVTHRAGANKGRAVQCLHSLKFNLEIIKFQTSDSDCLVAWSGLCFVARVGVALTLWVAQVSTWLAVATLCAGNAGGRLQNIARNAWLLTPRWSLAIQTRWARTYYSTSRIQWLLFRRWYKQRSSRRPTGTLIRG